ncbi:Ryp1 [Ascosphaera apis ARSEF 7405]|uniref:Ryp1 n=1 Tax=Ascosphaera apis ARSEF 7405 TaxID=392613 RepID=A0A167VZB9_9EURO|nr:Ryp1 [Ascosphaera apis ARSEF 7405]
MGNGSAGSSAHILEPTYTGYVSSTQDALILFEACLRGVLLHVGRRPHDRERNQLVRSGSIFIYEENSSGIKRWTDGVTWSPSRILGNFLVYRELDKPFPPGEKKRAMKKVRRPTGPSRPGEPYPRPESATNGSYNPSASTSPTFERPHQPEIERALVGSLVDSYGFKDSGLVKKTMSVVVQGVTHHLVSYYSVEDVLSGRLRSPSFDPELRVIRPRQELLKQSFRAPISDMDPSAAPIDDADNSALYYQRSLMATTAGYALPSAYYPVANYPTQAAQTALPAYPVNAAAMPTVTPSNAYMTPTTATEMPKVEDYTQYRPPTAPYATNAYDAIAQQSAMSQQAVATSPTNGVNGTMPMYRPPDNGVAAAQVYGRNGYGMAGAVPQISSAQQAATDAAAAAAAATRREQQMPAAAYYESYDSAPLPQQPSPRRTSGSPSQGQLPSELSYHTAPQPGQAWGNNPSISG